MTADNEDSVEVWLSHAVELREVPEGLLFPELERFSKVLVDEDALGWRFIMRRAGLRDVFK